MAYCRFLEHQNLRIYQFTKRLQLLESSWGPHTPYRLTPLCKP